MQDARHMMLDTGCEIKFRVSRFPGDALPSPVKQEPLSRVSFYVPFNAFGEGVGDEVNVF